MLKIPLSMSLFIIIINLTACELHINALSNTSMADSGVSTDTTSVARDLSVVDAMLDTDYTVNLDLEIFQDIDMKSLYDMSMLEYSLSIDFQNDWNRAISEIADQPARLFIDDMTTLGINSLGDITTPSNLTLIVENGSIDCADYSLTINGDFIASSEVLTVSGIGNYIFNGIEQIEVPWFKVPEVGYKIKQAIQSASNSQAKIIYFPPGEYYINNIANVSSGSDSIQRGSMILLNLPQHSDLTFRGAGRDQTRLEWSTLVPQTLNNWMFLIDTRQHHISNITIEDLTLDGNAVSDDYIQGVNLEINPQTNRVTFSNGPVELENGMKIRFRTEGGSLPDNIQSSTGTAYSYFLINKEGNSFHLSASLSNPIPVDIGSEGSEIRATYQRFATAIGSIGPAYAGTGSDLQLINTNIRNLTIEYFGNTGIGIREGEWFIDNVLVQDNSRDSWGETPGHHGLYASDNAIVHVSSSEFLRNGYGFDFWGGNATLGQFVQVSFIDSKLNENWFGGCKLGSANQLTNIQGTLDFFNVQFNGNGTSGLMETVVASEVNIPVNCFHCEFKDNGQNGINFGVDAMGLGIPIALEQVTVSNNQMNGVLVTGNGTSLILNYAQISDNGEFGLYVKTDHLIISELQLEHSGVQNAMRLVGSGLCQINNSSFVRSEGIAIQPSAGSIIQAEIDRVDLGLIYLGDRSESQYYVRNGSTWSTYPSPPAGNGLWNDLEN